MVQESGVKGGPRGIAAIITIEIFPGPKVGRLFSVTPGAKVQFSRNVGVGIRTRISVKYVSSYQVVHGKTVFER